MQTIDVHGSMLSFNRKSDARCLQGGAIGALFRFRCISEDLFADDPLGRFIQIFIQCSGYFEELRPKRLMDKGFGCAESHR